MSWVSS
jgi:hypothetical protein